MKVFGTETLDEPTKAKRRWTGAFNVPDKDQEDTKQIIKEFENYINPRKNIIYERFLFYSRYQKEN